MAEEQPQSVLQQLIAKRNEWAAEQPSVGAEIRAMAREAVKDVHNTMDQVFFGTPTGPGEPGTPLNPTPQMVTQDLGAQQGYQAMLDGYANRAAPEREPGKEMER